MGWKLFGFRPPHPLPDPCGQVETNIGLTQQGMGWADPEVLPSHKVTSLSERCQSLGGQLTLLQQPTANGLKPWPTRANHDLVAAVKREFDPLQQLARGRLPGV